MRNCRVAEPWPRAKVKMAYIFAVSDRYRALLVVRLVLST